MKLSNILTYAFVVAAAATVPTQNLPDYLVTIDLDDMEREMNGTGIMARKQIKACESNEHVNGPVAADQRNKADFAEAMASIIFQRSRRNNCAITQGTLDEISFRYSSTGNNCDTTAQQDTIQGALKKALALPGKDSIWPTMCLRLTHGGTWTGYLALGSAAVFDANEALAAQIYLLERCV
jgi:hypothetical protein